MKSRIKGHWFQWMILALAVRGVIFFMLSNELSNPGDNFIGIFGGDTDGYFKPIENYLAHGSYEPDYRMPGYGIPYYLLRLFSNTGTANNLIVILQFFLSAISVYYLALTARRMFDSSTVFYLVFFTFLISTYTQVLDLYLLTESFTVSASIFGLFYLVKGIQDRNRTAFFISGIWITWVVFLRPVYAPYILFFTVFIYYCMSRHVRMSDALVKYTLPFIIFFIVADGAWIARNFRKYQSIQPLTKTLYYPETVGSYYLELMKFFQSWGGNYIFWDPASEIRLMGVEMDPYGAKLWTDKDVKFPSKIFTTAFNEDSLLALRSLIIKMQAKDLTPDSTAIINDLLRDKLMHYTESVKTEHPFIYLVGSPLRYFRLFLFHSGTYNLMHDPWPQLTLMKKSIKVFYSVQYLFVVIAGIAGCVYLLFRRTKKSQFLLALLALYSIIIFPWILRLCEMRYLVPAFPFLVISSMFVTNEILTRFKSQRTISNK